MLPVTSPLGDQRNIKFLLSGMHVIGELTEEEKSGAWRWTGEGAESGNYYLGKESSEAKDVDDCTLFFRNNIRIIIMHVILLSSSSGFMGSLTVIHI